MRIGILTFHYSCNYGGVLQAYALQCALEELGHNVQVIDYVPTNYKHTLRSYFVARKSFIDLKKQGLRFLYSKRIKKTFNEFRQSYLKLSSHVNEQTISNLNDKYDAVVVGSDQVWNPSQHSKKVYFINWEPCFEGKRISYAPCCAINKVNENNRITLQKALHSFKAISVRNKETFDFVKSLINIEPILACDPTILYDFEIFAKSNQTKSPYILVYLLGKEIYGGHQKVVNALKRKFPNHKVIGIQTVYDNPQLMPWADQVKYCSGPKDWVNLIANAAFVYTDSFHGVIFSMKFKRKFACYYVEESRSSRFIDMSQRYGIAKNIIRNSDGIDMMTIDDFSTPDEALNMFDKQRQESLTFLETALR